VAGGQGGKAKMPFKLPIRSLFGYNILEKYMGTYYIIINANEGLLISDTTSRDGIAADGPAIVKTNVICSPQGNNILETCSGV
jgi:hypothetical protein